MNNGDTASRIPLLTFLTQDSHIWVVLTLDSRLDQWCWRDPINDNNYSLMLGTHNTAGLHASVPCSQSYARLKGSTWEIKSTLRGTRDQILQLPQPHFWINLN